ncbi:MAG: hypothetical protein ACTHJS_00655 [Xanthobacteraceae bacterium]
MASPINAVLCALVGAAFWSMLGYAVARHLLPRVLALGAAPVIGWAVFSAASLPILSLLKFSQPAVIGLATLGWVLARIWWRLTPLAPESPIAKSWLLAIAALVAAILAGTPAVALLPKYSQSGVHLAAPIFDHSKIAIVDAMMRQGLPPVNPVFGEGGVAGHLAYYYLWHFSAAELALALHVSGWEADIGLTWFTAFASLTLMMALAAWLSRRAGAAILVVALAASASLREVLSFLFGTYELEPFLQGPSGFAGWLFQAAWVPQHLMATSGAIASIVLLAHYAQRPQFAYLVTLALLVAASFESSAFVGGVTFAAAALAAAPLLLSAIEEKRRMTAILGLALAGALAVGLAAPFIRDQLALVAARGGASAIGVEHFEVLGEMFPQTLRRILDVPAYWLILLPLEFPATFIAGIIAFVAMLGPRASTPQWTAVRVLGVLAGVGLVISWLFVSRLGDNNDLALRAVLPAAMILIAVAAAGTLSAPRRAQRAVIAAFACGGLVLSLPDSAMMTYANWRGIDAADAATFAQTPELWSAVRRHASAGGRLANNPLFLQDLTPWPSNMSWALLADRSSCFAGRELAIPFAPLSPERREAINDQFVRVFAGQGFSTDVDDLATKYGCDLVVVVPQDGAWAHDPFAASAQYRLAESRDGRWRIYVRAGAGRGGQ